MRARLCESWPGLSYHFGLRPWDLYRLSPHELAAYVEALHDIAQENARS